MVARGKIIVINHHLYKNVSKKDISDQSIKEISLDRRSITYKKIPKISQETKKEITNILDEDADLILALNDL